MQYPGGAISWLATYLTQYFYYPWLGVSILCGLWFIICALLIWSYRLHGLWKALTLLLPMALMACLVQTGYWIFYQKLPGHLFVPTVGVLFATLCLVIQRLMDSYLPVKAAIWARLGWMGLVCILGYPFFGAWALGATGLLGMKELNNIRINKTKSNLFYSLLFIFFSFLLIAAVPQIYYQRLFEMTERSFIYVAALPSLRYSQDSFEVYRLPYYAIIVAFLILIATSFLINSFKAKTTQGKSSPLSWKRVWGEAFIVLFFIVAGIIGVMLTSKRSYP